MQPRYTGKHEKRHLCHTSHEKPPLFPYYMKTLCLSIVEIIKQRALVLWAFHFNKRQTVSDSLSYSSKPIALFHRQRESWETHHLLKYVTQLWTNQVEGIFEFGIVIMQCAFLRVLGVRQIHTADSASAAVKRDEKDKELLYYIDIMFGLYR